MKVMTGQLSSKESLEILWQMKRLPFFSSKLDSTCVKSPALDLQNLKVTLTSVTLLQKGGRCM